MPKFKKVEAGKHDKARNVEGHEDLLCSAQFHFQEVGQPCSSLLAAMAEAGGPRTVVRACRTSASRISRLLLIPPTIS